MTRYTKLEKKKYEKAAGFNIKPLQPDKERVCNVIRIILNSFVCSEIKSKRSEKRRQRRLKERQNKTICFGCRKKGHSVKDCTEAKEQGVGMCYNCSSTEHIAKDCKKTIKRGDEYLYAKCFICNEQGHLSRQCLKNEKGLYPNGGTCRFCSQVTHLAKDCTLKNQAIGTSVVVGKLDLQHGADDDDFHIQVLEMSEEKLNTIKSGKNKLKKKIVKF
ncbi:16871_t:CDS:2 [Funneliformis mosseae]|uniref:16871_t:CDS:1 n=1 Tax=Funneliformis mosseae TaxID=27381 RepID=A0A9N9BV85_FUNMO|nr:16871_t:CDS:2 [Funneliformis mosseae]